MFNTRNLVSIFSTNNAIISLLRNKKVNMNKQVIK